MHTQAGCRLSSNPGEAVICEGGMLWYGGRVLLGGVSFKRFLEGGFYRFESSAELAGK